MLLLVFFLAQFGTHVSCQILEANALAPDKEFQSREERIALAITSTKKITVVQLLNGEKKGTNDLDVTKSLIGLSAKQVIGTTLLDATTTATSSVLGPFLRSAPPTALNASLLFVDTTVASIQNSIALNWKQQGPQRHQYAREMTENMFNTPGFVYYHFLNPVAWVPIYWYFWWTWTPEEEKVQPTYNPIQGYVPL